MIFDEGNNLRELADCSVFRRNRGMSPLSGGCDFDIQVSLQSEKSFWRRDLLDGSGEGECNTIHIADFTPSFIDDEFAATFSISIQQEIS